MERIPKSPQHRQAHDGRLRGLTVNLEVTNKTDTASFVNGVASSVSVPKMKEYAAGIKLEFYCLLEATRLINQAANTQFQGRKRDIKEATPRDKMAGFIYNAGVGSRRRSILNRPLRRAIHKACNQSAFSPNLFKKAWELYNYGELPKIRCLSQPPTDEGIEDGPESVHYTKALALLGGRDGIDNTPCPARLEAAMRATVTNRVKPGMTVVEELLHHSLLDIETGMVMRERQILRAGMVVTNLAARLYRGRTDIFERHTESYTGPLMAFILDMSGSMSEYWPRALAVMGAVAHTLNRAGASTICVGFASSSYNNIIYQFQDAEEAFDIDRFHLIDCHNGNADAVAVEYCRVKLLEMDQTNGEPKKKYIIVFSDEQPAGMVYYAKGGNNRDGDDLRTLNQALGLCNISNIKTISILVNHHERETIKYHARTRMSTPEITLNRLLETMGVL